MERADIFRYLVLLRHGGVYADLDTQVGAGRKEGALVGGGGRPTLETLSANVVRYLVLLRHSGVYADLDTQVGADGRGRKGPRWGEGGPTLETLTQTL